MWLCIREFLLDPDRTIYWFPPVYLMFVLAAGATLFRACREDRDDDSV